MENKKIAFPLASLFLGVITLLNLYNFLELIFMGMARVFGFWSWVNVAMNIAIIACLVMKKRDIVLIGVLAARALLSLFFLLRGFSFLGLLDLVVELAIAAMALMFCEQNVIRLNLAPYEELVKKFFYAPAALALFVFVVDILSAAMNPQYFITFRGILIGLLDVAYIATLAMWLKDPVGAISVPVELNGANAAEGTTYTADNSYMAGENEEAYCGLGKHILLCLFTFGIWYLIWIYRSTKFLNRAPGADYHNPTAKLLLCLFIPFYQIYWYYKQGQRIDTMCRARGIPSDMATICLILAIFIPIVGCILMQDRINMLCTTQTRA